MQHRTPRDVYRRGHRPVLLTSRRRRAHGPSRRARLYSLGLILSLVASVFSVAGCGPRDGAGGIDQVIVTGSTTLLPIAEQAAEQFQQTHEGVSVLVSGLGSSAGIEAVITGTSDIGTSSRELKDKEKDSNLVDVPVAFDGIAVIVNPSNPVEDLSLAQLRAIYSGEITNWNEVGGEDRDIDLVNRDEASGTREAFKKIVMGEDGHFDLSAVVLPGTGQVRDVVARSKGAIGYISVGFVAPRFTSVRVKALKVDGVEATDETVASEEYPIARTLHFFTNGEAEGLSKQYIDYVLSDEVQDGVVVEAGFVPVHAREKR